MERPPEAYMHLGIVHFMLHPEVQSGEGPVLETIGDLVADGFFQALEVTHVADDTMRAEMARCARTARLALGYGAHPALLSKRLDLSAADHDVRQQAIETMLRGVDEACEIGAPMIGILDGPNSAPGKEDTEAAVQRVADSLKQICHYAAKFGIWVALEQFDRAIEKRSLLGPIDLCVRVSEMVRSETPNFGLCLDLSHLPLLNEDPPSSVRLAGDHIIQAHIGNCVMRDRAHTQWGDQHPVFGEPGGENDVPELTAFLQALFEIGYFEKELPTTMPLVSFEMKPRIDQTPAEIIGNCKRTFAAAWARV
jgi:sugar phosphate isomerase/epimerase